YYSNRHFDHSVEPAKAQQKQLSNLTTEPLPQQRTHDNLPYHRDAEKSDEPYRSVDYRYCEWLRGKGL
ncbi:MAG: hypothetical protein WA874_18570, partial [Chryseosolibacter sp.]